MSTRAAMRAIWTCFATFLMLVTARPDLAHAGCGCNKPPPLPATIIPGVAYHGMSVTLFDSMLVAGQRWKVTFSNGTQSATANGTVKFKRDITDSTGMTRDAQLIVTVPKLTPGPTSISAVYKTDSITIPASSFVLIGKPALVHQKNGEVEFSRYTTAVGSDGTLYVAVRGLNKVCDAMQFHAVLAGYPLRFGDNDVLIFNWQGYFIDALTPASHNHFSITAGDASNSDQLDYYRHSFRAYCKAHRRGGSKQIDPKDHNWHRDGTPHVDYSAVIFAIKGHFDDNSVPSPGTITSQMNLETELGDGTGDWEPEPTNPGVNDE